MPTTVVAGPRVPLVVATTVPGKDMERALAAGSSLEKAEKAIEAAGDDINEFLLALKNNVFQNTGADELLLHCGLSVTTGVNLGVELSATGDVFVELTWRKK